MQLNASHVQHSGIAVGLQVVAGVLSGDWLMASVFAGAVFFVREQTQAERRLKDHGVSPAQAVLESFKFWKWNADSRYDFYAPLVSLQWAWPLIV